MSQAPILPELANATTDRLAADSAKLLQEHAAAAAEDNVRKLRSYAESNPLVTAGIAFAAGALLSALFAARDR